MVRRRRALKRGLLAGGAIVLFVVVGMWLAAIRVPSWYQPVRVDSGQVQAVRDDLETAFDGLNVGMQGDQPFDVVIDQARLTSWLSVREKIWPGVVRYVPGDVALPVLSFAAGRVVAGGLVSRGPLRGVVSAEVTVEADAETVTLRLVDCRVGALPVPRDVVRRFLDGRTGGKALINGTKASALLDGVRVPNRFEWPNGRRPFRIESLELTDGQLIARIEPLARRQTFSPVR
jgi:hypothetical protein